MPTYDYICPKCKTEFYEIRGIRDYCDDPGSTCTKCGHRCGSDDRDLSKSKVTFSGTAVQNAEYNPGLGCVVKNKAHREELAKRKGLVEVGNDFGGGEKMQKHFDQKKREDREAKWAKDPGDFFL